MHNFFPIIKRPDWNKLSRLEKTCAYWAETHRLILDTVSHSSRYRKVRFEDMIKDKQKVAEVFEFLGLQKPAGEKLQKILDTPINSSGDPLWSEIKRIKIDAGMDLLPKFSEWSQSNQDALMRHCGEMARRIGYD